MTNHVHLLLTPHHAGACAAMMKQVNQRYVQRLNQSTGRSGTLWQGRFKSSLVANERYALACYRYVELNPVDAGLVAHARDYCWSSYRANAEGEANPIVSPHATYAALGDSTASRASAYRRLFDVRVPDADIEEIRKATRGGYPIGEKRPPRGRRPRLDHGQPELPDLEAVPK